MIVLAETAHDDGVCFLGQEEIAHKARLARAHVGSELKEMETAGVLQIRKAQRGRRRISVYRLNLPGLPEVAYDRLPFEVDRPFDGVGTSDTVDADGVRSSELTVSEVDDFSPVTPPIVNHPKEPPSQGKRKADPVWDALEAVSGFKPRTPSERQDFGRTVSELRPLLAEAEDPEAELRRRRSAFVRRWPKAHFTHRVFRNKWDELGSEPERPEFKIPDWVTGPA